MTAPSPGRKVVSYIWAALPFVTLGMASPLAHAYGALRLRSIWQWLAVVVYMTMVVVAFVVAGSPDGSAGDSAFIVVWLLSMLGGTIHASAIRRRVFFPVRPSQPAIDRAIDEVRSRRETRQRARDLARSDPILARELRIGRPDLARSHDDGGLVDVNHSPAHVLSTLPGMTPELVDRIVRTREQCGGFVSAEELAALAGLPPRLTPHLAEYTIFVR